MSSVSNTSDSLYDKWDWAHISQSDPDFEEERYEPDRPEDDEFYWAERLKKKNHEKISGELESQPNFLKIWDGPDQSRPLVAKRSDGYKAPITPIGSIAKMPSVPVNQQTNRTQSVDPYQGLKNQSPAQIYQQPQQQPVQQQSLYANQYSQPNDYTYTNVPLVSEMDSTQVTYSDIVNDKFKSVIPSVSPAEKIKARIVPNRPEYKISRQLFLLVNSIKLSCTVNTSELKVLIKKIVEGTIPTNDSENEICLYNADESARQLVSQIVSTREESDRLILLDGVMKILDMYLPTEPAAKEFVKANGATYPHPAYVGLQASLDALHYIAIWAANLEIRQTMEQIPVTRAIMSYLRKYQYRLSKLPGDIGMDTTQSILYYD